MSGKARSKGQAADREVLAGLSQLRSLRLDGIEPSAASLTAAVQASTPSRFLTKLHIGIKILDPPNLAMPDPDEQMDVLPPAWA